jgi:hypothetical protein
MTSDARFLWHPDLHEKAGERLYFVRLVFEPVYPSITPAVIEERLASLGVGSAHVYELIGSHDLIFRAWLSGDIHDFVERLGLPELRKADFMAVRDIHEHFVLPNGSATLRDTDALTVDLTQHINTLIHTAAASDDLSKYTSRGWIAPIFASDGVKFFLAISATIGTSTNIRFDDVLLKHVMQVLDQAGDLVQARSIYAGEGFARLLVLGRFVSARYFEFMDQVLLKLNDGYMRDLFNARTVTAFGSRHGPIIGREMLPSISQGPRSAPDDTRKTLDELLIAGEGSFIEIKASAFLNFDRLVHDGEPDWSTLRPEFVKAVCGMLNQHKEFTSTIIVGAIETKRYRQWLAQQDARHITLGDFTIVGVEEDNPSGDWDKYRRRLEDALESAIAPSPNDFMTIDFEEIRSEGIAKLVLRLEMEPVRRIFYAIDDDRLWVRRGAKVIDLHGHERDQYVEDVKGAANS